MDRGEYPRPDFVRDKWLSLNGLWDFRFNNDPWQAIIVPFSYQSELSGINTNKSCDIVWYKRKFKVPAEWKENLIKLNFGAVDYECRVYINGQSVDKHIGGHISFSMDITKYLNWSEEEIVVFVRDPWQDETIPRGKQYWLENEESIWYKRTTGIWQSVWLEPVNEFNFQYLKFKPDIDNGSVDIEFEISEPTENLSAVLEITMKGQTIANDILNLYEVYNRRSIDLFNKKVFRSCTHGTGWCWTPENPKLFDVKASLILDNKIIDKIDTYFGMRKIHAENGIIYLNNEPYYQKLVLDQGYWPNGLLTAPSDESFMTDIEMSKKMGFNGCRKHQKVEDPRFLYWADKLGFLVWGEMANCSNYSFKSVERITQEWIQVIKRDYNHPCIVAWVPLNESWGVPHLAENTMEQHHSLAMYHLTHSLDDTRLVITNDGWELTKTDICAVHNYKHGNKDEKEIYDYYVQSLVDKDSILMSQPGDRKIYAKGFKNEGEPIMLTEFGGITYNVSHSEGWGYTTAESEGEFLQDYERIIAAVYNSKAVYGFCYTQLSDVEQEMNGLLTYERKPKCDLDKISEINSKYRNNIAY